MVTELIIDSNEISRAEQKLNRLESAIGNKSTSISFSNSRGDTVDSLIELSDRLENTKNKLSSLYANTAKALSETRQSFNDTDNTIANYFASFGSWEMTYEK